MTMDIRFSVYYPDGTITRHLQREGQRYSWWHSETGPAYIAPYGYKMWFLYSKHVPCKTQEEFEKLMKLKAFW
jgi:hypothetical protein